MDTTAIWKILETTGRSFWAWLTKVDTLKDIAGKAIAALAVALLIWILKASCKVPGMLREKWRHNRLTRQFERYRSRLDQATFHVHHSWMKENQTLDDILVPVTITASGGAIENLENVLAQRFFSSTRSASPLRMVLTGPPGSGKSVALRIVARQSWRTEPSDGLPRYLPVLMSFADLRRSDFDLRRAISESLASREFSRGKECSVADFVGEGLSDGRLLVLIDGLDELKEEDRKEAVAHLTTFFGEHADLPVVITCRSVPFRDHRAVLTELLPTHVEMAEFIPAAVRRFVSHWRFDAPKSAPELLRLLSETPHLRELARNPLMLTILTFLYSLPKYRLPDNRALFYEVCVRALLEEWDQTRNTDRANRFDRPHKEDVLARIAFEHLCGPDPDRDIEERTALTIAADEMRNLGLNPSENVRLIKEIEHNSGLLVPLPPNGLRFPHQTFLEYFAGLYVLSRCSTDKLLALCAADPRRWREPLLLYCGLTTRQEDTRKILNTVLESKDIELALEIVTSARTVPVDIATTILERAGAKLRVQPTPALIEQLGYLSGNQQSAFSDVAHQHLIGQLAEVSASLSDETLHALVLALVRRPGTDSVPTLTRNFERLRLRSVLPTMPEDMLRQVLASISATSLSPESQQQLVDSLRMAVMPGALYELMVQSSDVGLVHRAAIALGQLSKEDAFWSLLDSPDLPALLMDPQTEAKLKLWGWPDLPPRSEKGRRILMTLARHLAQGMNDGSFLPFHDLKPDLDPLLSFLAHGLAFEDAWPRIPPYPEYRIDQLVIPLTRPRFSRSIWKNAIGGSAWFRVMSSEAWILFVSLESVAHWTITVLSCLALMSYGQHVDYSFAVVWLLAVPCITSILFIRAFGPSMTDRAYLRKFLPLGILAGPLMLGYYLHKRSRAAGKRGDCAVATQVLWLLLVFMELLSARTAWLEWSAYLYLLSGVWVLAVTANFSPFLFHMDFCSQHAGWLLTSKVARSVPVGARTGTDRKTTELGVA